MLPPVLKSIKADLTDKGYGKRTRLEDALLEELEAMDTEITTRIIEHKASDRDLITSGPASSCACRQPARFNDQLRTLFEAMSTGGYFGADDILHINGRLFDSADVIDLGHGSNRWGPSLTS